jgi:transposase
MNTERADSTGSPSIPPDAPRPEPSRPDEASSIPVINNVTLSSPLPDDVPVLHALIRELIDSLHKSQRECEGVRQRLDLLLRKLYGQKAERFDPNQPWLLPEMSPANATADNVAPPQEPPADANDVAPKGKRHGGRKPLPKELTRVRTEHTLSEAERLCPCCGLVCQKFGEDISEQLDYRPASVFVCQHVRFKYACPKCHDHITVGHAPVAVINKGLPGPGLLAHIVASKYADHLPLHRLERILGRHGVELSRKTMCDWMAHVATLVHPLTDLMAQLVRQSKAIHTDATKMPYLDPEVKGRSLSGQLWAFVGDRDHAFDVFAFSLNHGAAALDAFLQDHAYRGYLNADALNIYDHLFKSGAIIELGCWAHTRRNFYDAKENDPARAHVAMAHIRRLYEIEADARKLIAERKLEGPAADAVRFDLRQTYALTELTALKQWLQAEQSKVLPKSLIGAAISYALNHWQALMRYTSDGFLDIDNNIAERTLRHIAIGRKNWMFAGSAHGAETAATLFSLTSTCHRHGVDVFAYLQDILQRLAHAPTPTPEQLRAWLPDRWTPPTANTS